jgi:hypothetical protein
LARELVQRSGLFDATAVPVNVMPQRPRVQSAARALITRAETDGHIRLAEMNRSVETNLLTIISTLEHDPSCRCGHASSGGTCCGEGTSDAF